MAGNLLMITGGAILTIASGGSTAPALGQAIGIMFGTYAMVGGTAKTVCNAVNRSEAADEISNTLLGNAGKPVDKALGNDKKVVEKSLDLIQNISTAAVPSDNPITDAIGYSSVLESGVALMNEFEDKSKQNSDTNNNKSSSNANTDNSNRNYVELPNDEEQKQMNSTSYNFLNLNIE